MRTTKKFIMMFTLLTFIFSTVATTAFAETAIDWEKGIAQATGMGIVPQGATSYKSQARQAARMDALRILSEMIKGVSITGETTLELMLIANDSMEAQIYEKFLQYAKSINDKFIGEGKDMACELTLQWSLYGQNSVAAIVIPKPKIKLPFPKPMNTALKVPSNYTGIVVDCRGLGLQPAMASIIMNDNGLKIYSYENVDYDKVINMGIVAYTSNPKNIARAGSNPLIVKALSIQNYGSNPVISSVDADKILIANQSFSINVQWFSFVEYFTNQYDIFCYKIHDHYCC